MMVRTRGLERRRSSVPVARPVKPEDQSKLQLASKCRKLCDVCEGEENDAGYGPPSVFCYGKCLRMFHTTCLATLPGEQCVNNMHSFLCQHCKNAQGRCFECGEVGDAAAMFFCKKRQCGAFFHRKCLAVAIRRVPLTRGRFACPRHRCHICGGGHADVEWEIEKCIRCPRAVHDRCADPRQRYVPGGSICMHHQPLETTSIFPLDGIEFIFDSQWVTYDYYEEFTLPREWFQRGTEQAQKKGASKSAVSTPSKSQATVSRFSTPSLARKRPRTTPIPALDKASAESSPAAAAAQSGGRLPYTKVPKIKWKDLMRNKYLCAGPPPLKSGQVDPCFCDPLDQCGDRCVNRIMKYECVGECPCGDACTNRRLQRMQYANISIVKTLDRGYGVIADTKIREGDLVIEYCGEVLNSEQYQQRLEEMRRDGVTDFYMLTLTSSLTIDAGRKGNRARFINHSCEPNCHTEKWIVGNEARVAIFASRDIEADEELTYDYLLELWKEASSAQECRCGAAACSGFLNARSKKAPERPSTPSAPPKKRKARKDPTAPTQLFKRDRMTPPEFKWSVRHAWSTFGEDRYANEARHLQVYLPRVRRAGRRALMRLVHEYQARGCHDALATVAIADTSAV